MEHTSRTEDKRLTSQNQTYSASGFQDRLTTYLAVSVLAESDAPPRWGLVDPLRDIWPQAPAEICDVIATTFGDGCVFVQAEANADDVAATDRRLESALARSIRQYLRFRTHRGARPWERRLEPGRDRIVLAFSAPAPSIAGIGDVLRAIGDGVFGPDEPETLGGPRGFAAMQMIARTWQRTCQGEPTRSEMREWAALVRVDVLEVKPGEHEERVALRMLGQLLDAGRAASVLDFLCCYCRRLSRSRVGADRPALVEALARRGTLLPPPVSLRETLAQIRRSTEEVLLDLGGHAEIRVGADRVHIRRPITDALCAMLEQGHVALTGEAGLGKSGAAAAAAKTLKARGWDVLAASHRTRGASVETLASILKHVRPHTRGAIVIDGLEAWFDPQHAQLQRLLEAATEAHWNVLASVRTFDLTWSTSLRQLFRGSPHPEYRISALGDVRHVYVPTLRPGELEQIAAQSTVLHEARLVIPWPLSSPLDLWILAKVVEAGGTSEEIGRTATPWHLRELFWERRTAPHASGAQELLQRLSAYMLDHQSLRVPVEDAVGQGERAVFQLLLQAEVLVSERDSGTGAELVSFSNELVLDLALARLHRRTIRTVPRWDWWRSPDLDATDIYGIERQWHEDVDRAAFWTTAMDKASRNAPLLERMRVAWVAAAWTKAFVDLEPLYASLRSEEHGRRAAAETCLRDLVSAAGGIRDIDASPRHAWAQLALRCSELARREVNDCIKPLLSQLARVQSRASNAERAQLERSLAAASETQLGGSRASTTREVGRDVAPSPSPALAEISRGTTPVGVLGDRLERLLPDSTTVSPSPDDAMAAFEACRQLRDFIDTPGYEGLDSHHRGQAWRSLVLACAKLAERDAGPTRAKHLDFLRACLADGAEVDIERSRREPEVRDRPLRAVAVAALLALAEGAAVDDRSAAVIERLSADASEDVQVEVARRCQYLLTAARDLFWRVAQRLRATGSARVLGPLLDALRRAGNKDASRVVSEVVNIHESSDAPGMDAVRRDCRETLLSLYLLGGEMEAFPAVEAVLRKPSGHVEEVGSWLPHIREALTCGPLRPTDSGPRVTVALTVTTQSAEETRMRGKLLCMRLVESILSRGRISAGATAREGIGAEDARLLGGLAAELRVALDGPAPIDEVAELDRAVVTRYRRRFNDEIGVLIDLLLRVPIAEVNGHLAAVVEVISEFDPPAACRRMVRMLAGVTPNYDLEVGGAKDLVRLLGRCLVDHWHLLRDDRECVAAVVRAFEVCAHWPEAAELVHGFQNWGPGAASTVDSVDYLERRIAAGHANDAAPIRAAGVSG
jgi:hypothetical protein